MSCHHATSIPYATERWRAERAVATVAGAGPTSPGNSRPSSTSRTRCRTPSRTAPGRPSRSPPTAATSARSTCSSRPPAACSSSRSRAHPGTATNNGSTWMFRDDDKTRTIENPLHFTDRRPRNSSPSSMQAARKLRVKEPHSPHRGGRLPVRGEPPLRVRRVPAPARLRPRQARRADRPRRHLDRLPQPAAAQRA